MVGNIAFERISHYSSLKTVYLLSVSLCSKKHDPYAVYFDFSTASENGIAF
jgi:hypothetical protein